MAYDFKKVEEKILKYWAKNKIHSKLKKKTSKGERFFFLDGPPYATGNPHPGTAINRGLKDLVRRYKWMKGYNVWDQPGFDMHGLPIESMVEQKLGLKNKEEIIEHGVKEFVGECRKYAFKYLGVMGDVFNRLGEWADWDNPYETTNNDYIEGVWWALQKIWERGGLYEGSKVLTWCPHCGTALAANYEITHKSLREPSIYVKFPIVGEENAFLIIWTTTPWTLSSNMAVMANPDITYARVKVGSEEWIIAEELVQKLMDLVEKKGKVLKAMKGKDLAGTAYEHPFKNEVPYHSESHGKKAYTVVLSKKHVNLEEGTGLVHCAPGCGPEDQEVGNKNKIPSFSPINENGVFTEEGGEFAGLKAKSDDQLFIDKLESKGLLVAQELIQHDYPHCERCKSPVVFKDTEQWFIKVTKFQQKMISENKIVNWVPEWAGKNQFHKWLEGIRDWCITRQRFWGIPLPVWKCDKCGEIKVIGSIRELEALTGKVPKDLHKPVIDSFKWECKCGGEFSRNPDVIDVWIDSACAPFASLPQPREEWMKKLGKMDFTVEAKDQIRGWFYSLMGIGVSAFDQVPYSNIFMHGYLCDEQGFKLSKRKGNYMSMTEIFKELGADTFRTSLLSTLTPGVDSRFLMDEVSNAYKALNVVWNTHDYLSRHLKYYKVKPKDPKKLKLSIEDKWLLSRLNSLIKRADELMTSYHLEDYAPAIIHFLVEDVSRSYIKLIRNRLIDEPTVILSVLYEAYTKALRLLGPVAPFISEQIYLNLEKGESLFLEGIPSFDKSLIDTKLEEEMDLLQELITATLAAREKGGLSVRWPLPEVLVTKEVPSKFEGLFLEYVNAKSVKSIESHPEGVKLSFKPDFSKIKSGFGDETAGKIIPQLLKLSDASVNKHLSSEGFIVLKIDGEDLVVTSKRFIKSESLPNNLASHDANGFTVYVKTELSSELLAEGYARELIRRLQQARKEMGLKKKARIQASIKASKEFEKLVTPHLKEIKTTVGAKSLDFKPSGKYDFSKTHKLKDYEVTVKVKAS